MGFALNNDQVRSMIGTLGGLLVGMVLALIIMIAGDFSGVVVFVVGGLVSAACAEIGSRIATRRH